MVRRRLWQAIRIPLAMAVAVGLWCALAAPALAASDLRGTWTAKISLGGSLNNTQYWRLSAGNPAAGTYTGETATTPAGNAFGTLTATLSGSAFQMTNPYSGGGYTATFTGTLAADGVSLSGTWTSGPSQTGTWTAALTTPATPAPTPVPGPVPDPGLPPTPNGKKPSVVSVFCNRGPDATSSSQCTASVADAGVRPPRTPTGTVSWTATTGALAASTCTLTATSPSSPSVATCTVTYLPGAQGTPAGTALPVAAHYDGDATFAPSGATHRLISPVCIGTPSRPCPGTVADAFGFRPTLSFTAQATLVRLRALISCGAGIQTAAQIGIGPAGASCSTSTLLSVLFGDASNDLAKQLDAKELDRVLSSLRSAFEILGDNGPGPDKPCAGRIGGGPCGRFLGALGFGPKEIERLGGQLTFADIQGTTDLLADAYLNAGGVSTDTRLTVYMERLARDQEQRRAICRGLDPAGFTYRALHCALRLQEQARAHRAPRTLVLARSTATVPLGASASIGLRLTPGARLLDGVMHAFGVRRIRTVVSSSVRIGGGASATASRRLVISLR